MALFVTPFFISILIGYLIGRQTARNFPGWIILLGYGTIVAVSFLCFQALARGYETDTAILIFVLFALPTGSTLLGWTLGMLLGWRGRRGGTEKDPPSV
jgi:hypothetical protein